MSNSQILKGKKVFLVEDDLFFARLVSNVIIGEEAAFLHAINGEEAIKEIPKQKPDILLLDLMLPGNVDGYGVLEKIKSDPNTRNIPVVIISNLSGNKDVEKGMRLGAFRYLVKATVSLQEIVSNLESALTSIVK